MNPFFLSSVLVASMAVGTVTVSAIKVTDSPVDSETGREVQCDLPKELHLRNIRGKNGEGCCVYASGEMMARYFAFEPLYGTLKEGLGGATDAHVKRLFDRKAPGFKGYAQATGKDSVPFLDWCMRTYRLPCITYGRQHMVILLHLDPEGVDNPRACVVDNNRPGQWIWMSRAEFIRKHQEGGAWSYCLLISPPPPIPVSPRG